MRRTVLWVVLAIAGVAGAFYARSGFPRAFSIINADLRMDRGAALATADSLADVHDWGPEGARTAAIFEADYETQTFIELEGGGADAFRQALDDDGLTAYAWRVRRFAPGEVREVTVTFFPDGRPAGFDLTLPEDEPGPAIERDSARFLAEDAAAREWGVALDAYAEPEAASESRATGRLDHTFTYERRDQPFGEGRIRLRLAVSGDRVTAVERYFQVPEAFERRYAEMRSANESITAVSTWAWMLLYGAGGIGAGLILLLRRRRVVWRQPLVAAGVIAVLQAAALANLLPLQWFAYDTTLPVASFLLFLVAGLIFVTAMTVVQIGFSAMAAESLARTAFPEHPQFWRIWGRSAAPTPRILGQIMAGYLLIGVFLAYMVAFWTATGGLGWWNPSEMLIEPNLLATRFPWLIPVANAVQAGFWEECLFRAVPLSAAALIGDRFGNRRAWIAAAFVLQALVFAAAHANYPAQPAYARVVELILPSFLFGALFLQWGLLPAVILHAGYDLVLMSIPVFASEAPGAWASRVVILLVAAIPLAVVAVRRVHAGWGEFPASLLNRAWEPGAAPEAGRRHTEARVTGSLRREARWLWPVALTGVVLLAVTARWRPPIPGLTLTRSEALAMAPAAFPEGSGPPEGWTALAEVVGPSDPGHDFIRETAGDSVWLGLVGVALDPVRWRVRFVQFTGDVAERAEEWQVSLSDSGTVWRARHVVPEGRPGTSLDEPAAVALAGDAVREILGLDSTALVPAATEPTSLPARRDWAVTWTDETVDLPEGEVRVGADIAGDEVVGVWRGVRVPESWTREQQRREIMELILPAIAGLLYFSLGFGMLVLGAIRLARHQLPGRVLLGVAGAMFLVDLIGVFNRWPAMLAGFSTTEPLTTQIWMSVGGALLAGVVFAGAVGVMMATALPVKSTAPRAGWAGAGLALGVVGLVSLVVRLGRGPELAVPSSLETVVPVLAVFLNSLSEVLVGITVLALPMALAGWLQRRSARVAQVWLFAAGALPHAAMTEGLGPRLALAGIGGVGLILLERLVRSGGAWVVPGAVVAWMLATGAPDAARTGLWVLVGLLPGVAVALALLALLWRPAEPAVP